MGKTDLFTQPVLPMGKTYRANTDYWSASLSWYNGLRNIDLSTNSLIWIILHCCLLSDSGLWVLTRTHTLLENHTTDAHDYKWKRKTDR